MELLEKLNAEYVRKHNEKEENFWALYMGLKDYKQGTFEKKEQEFQRYISDPSRLPLIREALEKKNLSDEDRTALEGWLRFFETNSIENPEAAELSALIIEQEGILNKKRSDYTPGYIDPDTDQWVETGSSKLSLQISNAKEEPLRKCSWEGLRSIEDHVLESGFVDIVKQRNRLGRMLGYEDYYDYKVQVNEGFSKVKLFSILDDLEKKTRSAAEKAMSQLTSDFGKDAAQPWNFRYFSRGDLSAQLDPYFPFDGALSRWGLSFTGLGVDFNNAELKLDLLYRKGKYENGFMHGPLPAYRDRGEFRPAAINFTAIAHPQEIGGGKRALETLMHEGGHAAHFANIDMPAPCFAQEFAPTSVALAETQSMFMDYFLDDPVWLHRYARDKNGKSMPASLIWKNLANHHRYFALEIRSLLVVPYAEKALYEMEESQLTPENILKTLRDIERRFFAGMESPRPVLSIPHLLAGESSAYYHAYVLAWLGVFQFRSYFHSRYGYIVDNPAVGEELKEKGWRTGNLYDFLQTVKNVTGEDFSADAAVEFINTPINKLEKRYLEIMQTMDKESSIPEKTEFHARIQMVHGDTVLADNSSGFEEMSRIYGNKIPGIVESGKKRDQ